MEKGSIDYLSFVRGFIAATTEAASSPETAAPGGVDAISYSAGYTAGSTPPEPLVHYRELSVQDQGRFSGTLNLQPEHHEELPAASGVLDLSESWYPSEIDT